MLFIRWSNYVRKQKLLLLLLLHVNWLKEQAGCTKNQTKKEQQNIVILHRKVIILLCQQNVQFGVITVSGGLSPLAHISQTVVPKAYISLSGVMAFRSLCSSGASQGSLKQALSHMYEFPYSGKQGSKMSRVNCHFQSSFLYLYDWFSE